MSTVILAEKPSQALAYASTFSYSKKPGYFEVMDSLFPDETFITFGFGHLVELVPPKEYDKKWEKWSLESLPIFPEQFKFNVAEDKQKQFNIVKKLLLNADTIIIATDSDREGENIAWSIIEKAGANSDRKTFKRLWINSLEKSAIREGFKNLRNGLEYLPYYKEAQTRQLSDWLIGMNGSPLYSLLLQKKGIQGAFSLGRVQTPTLFMIYSRQLEIENFKKEKFYELESTIHAINGDFKANLTPKQQFETKELANEFLSTKGLVNGKLSGSIQCVTTTNKKTNSPLLFSLSSLQTQVNKQFKASANETLQAVQSLYEAKLLTYPRTDTTVITENEFKYLKNRLPAFKESMGVKLPATQLEARKRYVNGEKVQEHHAIIPTKKIIKTEEFEKLSTLQKNIYTLVTKTTIAMFLPDYEFQETAIEAVAGDLNFIAKGKTPLNMGWKELFSSQDHDNENKETLLPPVKEKEKIIVEIAPVQKETKPPKPFTEGTLITAMKTAGKALEGDSQQILKEVEGIGTEATRANIIETLKKKKYVEIKKNNLVVTSKGKTLCLAVADQRLLTSAKMTAEWESYLKKIGKNEGTQEQFLINIKKFITHLISSVPASLEKKDFSALINADKEKDEVGKCPKCNQSIVKKGKFYGCTGYPTCKFTLSGECRGKKLTKTNIKQLLSGKETIVKGIKKRDSTGTYDAVIALDHNGYYQFKRFPDTKVKK